MFEEIVTEEEIKFNSLEKKIFKYLIEKVNSRFVLKLEFSLASKFQ